MTTERSGMSLERLDRAIDELSKAVGNCFPLVVLRECREHLSRDAVNYTETPEGWVLVPVEPTESMVNAGACQISMRDSDTQGAVACWERMIANAPEAMLAQRDGGK